MNPITLLIVTVLANAVVTGIIVYLIQKRIERSYNRQMEEFRSSLQYSLFEQQTKFARTHEKRLETLENLYQKYVLYEENFDDMVSDTLKFTLGENDDFPIEERFEILWAKKEDNWKKFVDFRTYFTNNRIYLSSDASSKVNNIIHRNEMMDWIFFLFVETTSPTVIKMANNAIRHLDLVIAIKSNVEKPEDLKLLLLKMNNEVQAQSASLENLYKSVAYTTDKENDK